MKMLATRTPVATALPVQMEAIRQHCRVDFLDDDDALQSMARTAALEIEQFAQVALLTQTIGVTIFDPAPGRVIRLPLGPVAADATVTVTIDGASFTDFTLAAGIRPVLRLGSSFANLCPEVVVIEYPAGFGNAAEDIPDDLTQAILDQTAAHYDGRSPMDRRSVTSSPHMARIAARYRGVQA